MTDNLTGLIWLGNASCYGVRSWVDAMTLARGLASGACGLADGSTAGEWRVPNVKELISLLDFAYSVPALSNTAGTGQMTGGDPFTNVETVNYWTSSAYTNNPTLVWLVELTSGPSHGQHTNSPPALCGSSDADRRFSWIESFSPLLPI
ncbi:MAG: DUF1566 domain-containing protein [Holophagales bacterium]|nr:DUF1566 domain-containing protein [Holophagales bacterium]